MYMRFTGISWWCFFCILYEELENVLIYIYSVHVLLPNMFFLLYIIQFSFPENCVIQKYVASINHDYSLNNTHSLKYTHAQNYLVTMSGELSDLGVLFYCPQMMTVSHDSPAHLTYTLSLTAFKQHFTFTHFYDLPVFRSCHRFKQSIELM